MSADPDTSDSAWRQSDASPEPDPEAAAARDSRVRALRVRLRITLAITGIAAALIGWGAIVGPVLPLVLTGVAAFGASQWWFSAAKCPHCGASLSAVDPNKRRQGRERNVGRIGIRSACPRCQGHLFYLPG